MLLTALSFGLGCGGEPTREPAPSAPPAAATAAGAVAPPEVVTAPAPSSATEPAIEHPVEPAIEPAVAPPAVEIGSAPPAPAELAAAAPEQTPCDASSLLTRIPILALGATAEALFDEDRAAAHTLGRVTLRIPADAHVARVVLVGAEAMGAGEVTATHGDEIVARARAARGDITLELGRPGGLVTIAGPVRVRAVDVIGCAGTTLRASPRRVAAIDAHTERVPLELSRARYAPDRSVEEAPSAGSMDALDAELAALFQVESRALGRVRLRARGAAPVEIVLAISRGPAEPRGSAELAPLVGSPTVTAEEHADQSGTRVEPEPAAPEPAASPAAPPAGQEWRPFAGSGQGCTASDPHVLRLVRIVRADPVRYDTLALGEPCEVRAASMRVGDLDGDGWPELRLDWESFDESTDPESSAGAGDRGAWAVIVDVASFLPELDMALSQFSGNDYAYSSTTARLAMRDVDGDGRRDAERRGRREEFDVDFDETHPTRTAIDEVFLYDAETDVFVPMRPPTTPPPATE